MTFSIIKLKDVLTESKVEASISDTAKRIRVRLHAKGVEKRPDMNDKDGATKYYVRRAGQFVYGRQNLHKGAFGVIPPELDGYQSSSDIPSFDVDERCLPEWVDLFLKQGGYYLELSKLASGVGSQRISPSKFLSLEMPLPSIEQQRTLLERVGFYNGSQQKLKFELTHQQTLLKKLRQQILQEAIEGKLTADWRAQNPDVEPASELLKRIAAEKEQLVKDKKIKAQKPLPLITDEEKPFELPDGWEWCRLGNLGAIQGGGTPSKVNKDYWNGDVPWICPKDMKKKYLSDSIYKITPQAVVKSSAKFVAKRSVLFVVRGMILSHSFPVAINIDKATVNQDMKALSIYIDGLEEYIYLVLRGSSQEILKKVRTSTHGTCRLESDIYCNWVVAMPSLDEQQIIITKVEKLLTLCDQIEAQITQNQAYTEQLMQAVLKEAFSHNSKAKPVLVTPQASTDLSDVMVCEDQ